jgi:hypothetical protein
MKKIILLSLLLNVAGAEAQEKFVAKDSVVTLPVGSPLRKQLLNLSRPKLEQRLKQQVEFLEPKIRVLGDYAMVFSQTQQKGGKPLDLKKAKLENEPYDNNYQAIYKRVKGKWTILVEYDGCTDVCWLEWMDRKELGIPRRLFPIPIGEM